MKKAVLIPIHPQWCELIASGKKTIEVRKTRPKIETPFKCYIYQTKKTWGYDIYSKIADWQGKVIGEFVCDITERLRYPEDGLADVGDCKMSCLSGHELISYSAGKPLYGWHISNLKIYDEPKSLSCFYVICDKFRCEGCEHLKYQAEKSEYDYECEFLDGKIPIIQAPQSWCYVEELI